MLSFLSIINFIKVKMLLVKGFVLATVAPHLGLYFAGVLFYVLVITITALSLLAVIIATVKLVSAIYRLMFASKGTSPIPDMKKSATESLSQDISDDKVPLKKVSNQSTVLSQQDVDNSVDEVQGDMSIVVEEREGSIDAGDNKKTLNVTPEQQVVPQEEAGDLSEEYKIRSGSSSVQNVCAEVDPAKGQVTETILDKDKTDDKSSINIPDDNVIPLKQAVTQGEVADSIDESQYDMSTMVEEREGDKDVDDMSEESKSLSSSSSVQDLCEEFGHGEDQWPETILDADKENNDYSINTVNDEIFSDAFSSEQVVDSEMESSTDNMQGFPELFAGMSFGGAEDDELEMNNPEAKEAMANLMNMLLLQPLTRKEDEMESSTDNMQGFPELFAGMSFGGAEDDELEMNNPEAMGNLMKMLLLQHLTGKEDEMESSAGMSFGGAEDDELEMNDPEAMENLMKMALLGALIEGAAFDSAENNEQTGNHSVGGQEFDLDHLPELELVSDDDSSMPRPSSTGAGHASNIDPGVMISSSSGNGAMSKLAPNLSCLPNSFNRFCSTGMNMFPDFGGKTYYGSLPSHSFKVNSTDSVSSPHNQLCRYVASNTSVRSNANQVKDADKFKIR